VGITNPTADDLLSMLQSRTHNVFSRPGHAVGSVIMELFAYSELIPLAVVTDQVRQLKDRGDLNFDGIVYTPTEASNKPATATPPEKSASARAADVTDFNRDHMIGTHVEYWTGVREGRGKFSTTRSAAELLGGHTPVVWVAGHSACIALTHVEPIPDQPDGIDEYDDRHPMPHAQRAAERVLAYVTEFGDGLYDVVGGAPLYGRDLVAICRAAKQATTTTRPEGGAPC
jgi:hypothetical protein